MTAALLYYKTREWTGMAENNNNNNRNGASSGGNMTNAADVDTGEAVGTVGGAAVGAAVGSVLGPAGTVAGGVAGAAMGNQVGEGAMGDNNNSKKCSWCWWRLHKSDRTK